VQRAEADAIYNSGRHAVVHVLLELSAQNQRLASQVEVLSERVARQDERIAQLERRLNRNSANSSQPPSADPPKAPPRRSKGLSGRNRGAQSGHEGSGRELLPACAVDEVVEHWPVKCACGHVFTESERQPVGEPARHQIEELPQLTASVIEHRAQRLRCRQCGRSAKAALPDEVTVSAFGPRLRAAIATLSVRNRISRRDAAELSEQLFGARICAGSVDAILARTADALGEPYEDLVDRVRGAKALNMDETGWKTAGERRALWGAFTDRHALLAIASSRHEEHAKTLLGDTSAVVTSDRWWAYAHLPLARRQICWAHLKRDFAAHTEGLGAEKEFGEMGLALCKEVFAAWALFGVTADRRELKLTIRALQRTYKPVIVAFTAKRARNRYCRRMAANLLKVWPALWTFAKVAGVCPTNNHAERALRSAVIYRKLSFGSQSESGERRIERLLSAHTTCRLQHRSLFDYLAELLAAHARGDPVPLLA
jgi:transposase